MLGNEFGKLHGCPIPSCRRRFQGILQRDRQIICAEEVVRVALREFITHRRFGLVEQQQLQDIAWALQEKPARQ